MSKTKQVLGRGLDALISADPEVPAPVKSAPPQSREVDVPVTELSVDLIRPNPYQPRENFEPDALDELKRSILEHGLLQPVTVRKVSGGYELIAGERRLRAVRAAGLKLIPVHVREVKSDEELLELALIENVQREHLNPIEIAAGYQRLIDECHLTQEDVAEKVSKDRTTVANLLRLLKLPNEIQDSLRHGEVTMGHARALINVPTIKAQMELWKKVVSEGLSVRRTEALAREATHTAEPPVAPRKHAAPVDAPSAASVAYRSVESRLRDVLLTQVKVRDAGDGKGEILIEFYSDDELDRLIELIESGPH